MLRIKKKKALVFASSFPVKFDKNIYVPLSTFIWNGGELPKIFRKRTISKINNKVKTKVYDSLISNSDEYDNYCDLYKEYYNNYYNNLNDVEVLDGQCSIKTLNQKKGA